jgi:hypothetical protein
MGQSTSLFVGGVVEKKGAMGHLFGTSGHLCRRNDPTHELSVSLNCPMCQGDAQKGMNVALAENDVAATNASPPVRAVLVDGLVISAGGRGSLAATRGLSNKYG